MEPIQHSKYAVYLGDGCYFDFDGYAIHLTTEDGISVTNRVILEPSVYEALLEAVDRLKQQALNA